MEVNTSVSLAQPPQASSRGSDSAQDRLERVQNSTGAAETNNAQADDSASTASVSNDVNARPAQPPTESPQAQAALDEARQAESDRRRDDAPSQQLQNQIEDLLGSPNNIQSQIDEFV